MGYIPKRNYFSFFSLSWAKHINIPNSYFISRLYSIKMKRKSVKPRQTNPSRSISTHPSAKGVHKDIIISSVYLIAINRERETTVQVFDSLHLYMWLLLLLLGISE
jgi:hypothetical protein